jgi:tRNA 2-thiouridine synthesizing protein B
MTLHIVSASPRAGGAFEDCLRVLAPGDALLLTGDAVYALLPGTGPALSLAGMAESVDIHALRDDCSQRGIGALPAGVGLSDYADFVALACAHPRSVSWF